MKGVCVSGLTRSLSTLLLNQPRLRESPTFARQLYHCSQHKVMPRQQQQHHQQQQQQQQQQQVRNASSSTKKRCTGLYKDSKFSNLGGKRCNHKQSKNEASICHVSIRDSDQLLQITQGRLTVRLPYVWLRDHCKSERYFNHNTQQRISDLSLLDRDLTPDSVHSTDEELSITWKDGHVTVYSLDWLFANSYQENSPGSTTRVMWDGKVMKRESLPVVPYKLHMTSEDGLRQSLQNLVKYGFTIVSEAPPTPEGTKLASERVSPIQESMYGGLWTVTPTMGNNDTAYTHESLGAHTDNTYLTSPAGIEVFHVVEHNGTGGETLLVDGFNAVDVVRREDPESFRTLQDTPIPFEYMATAADGKPPYYMKTVSPIFTVHPATGECMTFRFNAYDRGNLDTVDPEKMTQFYKAYLHLSQVISRPESELRFKLEPGLVLLVDNWRVMHGRTAFTGQRLLSGCYLSRDEWMSQARLFSLLR